MNSLLDPQNEIYALAHVTPEELAPAPEVTLAPYARAFPTHEDGMNFLAAIHAEIADKRAALIAKRD